jgi:hypothetical protein
VRLSCFSEDRIELGVGIKVTYDKLGKESRLLKVVREFSALNSLDLDTDNDALIVQRDNVVLTAGTAMSDTEHLNISLPTASFLDSIDNFGVVVLDIPVLDADLFHLARMVDQVSKLVCDSSVLVLA